MKCKFCGAELEENVTVCPACGEITGEVTGEAMDTTENTENNISAETPEQPIPAEKKKGFPLKAVTAIGCCAVLLFGLYKTDAEA